MDRKSHELQQKYASFAKDKTAAMPVNVEQTKKESYYKHVSHKET